MGEGRVRTCFNPDYRGSSLLALMLRRAARRELVLYMDADVLYDCACSTACWARRGRLSRSLAAIPTRNGWSVRIR